jgi:hypothetical protein
MKDGAEKTALTLKLFGRGGDQVLKWLDASKVKIAATNRELVKLGMVWGDKQITTWKQLVDAQHEMSLQWTGLQLQLAQDVLPLLRELMGDLSVIMGDFSKLSPSTQMWTLRLIGLAGAASLVAKMGGALGVGKLIGMLGGTAATGAATAGAGTAVATGGAEAAGGAGSWVSGMLAGGSSTAGLGAGAGAGVPATAAAAGSIPVTLVAAPILAGIVAGAVVQAHKTVYAPQEAAYLKTHDYFQKGGGPVTGSSGQGSLASIPGGGGLFGSETASAGRLQAAMVAINRQAKAIGDTDPHKMEKLIADERLLQKVAAKPILLGDISAKHTPQELLAIRDGLMKSLHMTASQANYVMHTMFKDWNPMKDLSPKVKAAEALLQRNIKTFHQLGLDLSGGLAQGVQDGQPWAVRAVKLLSQGMVAEVESDLRTHSPSLVFHQIGLNVTQGWANGIEAGKGAVYHAVKGVVNHMMNAAGLIGGSRSDMGGLSGPSSSSGNVQLGKQLAAQRGWTGAQFNALYELWTRESGWRNTAQNPTSTAYGIAQFLDSTWSGYTYGKTSDPRKQIIDGLEYIKKNYGSPLGALSHENAFNWYGSGGHFTVDQPTVFGAGERGREHVDITPDGQSRGVTFIVHGDVYGWDDFKKKVGAANAELLTTHNRLRG